MNSWDLPPGRLNHFVAKVGAPARRHAKAIGAWVDCPAVDFVYALLACQCARIYKCIGVPFNIDHVLPYGAGGKHAAGNLQVVPRVFNTAKGCDLNYRLPEPYRNP